MRRLGVGAVVLTNLLALSGCQTATRVTEVPRVDLDLGGGNRGYLVGTPPPDTAALKTTRRMVQTDVELPTLYKPTHGTAPVGPVSVEVPLPPEAVTAVEPTGGEHAAPARYDTYVVRKGDSLSSIAAKPEIYGRASRWRRIFDANRTLLKSPDRVRAGMKLKIPRGGHAEPRAVHGNKGVLYKK